MTNINPASGNALGLPSACRDQLHDDIALALDAISTPKPTDRNMAEAASYLRHALRLIGGAA